MVALSVMTLVSVAIGYACKHVPDALTTSVPVGEYLGIALLIYFGIRSLRVRTALALISSETPAADACM